MNNIYVLSESDTIKLLEMEEVIEAVENVYREKNSWKRKAVSHGIS